MQDSNQTSLEELEEKYIALGEEIAKLKNKETPKEFPQIGDTYWFIPTCENLIDYHYFDNDEIDYKRQSIGNFFQYKEQAIAEYETLKVIQELKNCEGSRKFVVNDTNYCLEYRTKTGCIVINYWNTTIKGVFDIYFDTEDAARSALEKVGRQRIINAIKWRAQGDYSWVDSTKY